MLLGDWAKKWGLNSQILKNLTSICPMDPCELTFTLLSFLVLPTRVAPYNSHLSGRQSNNEVLIIWSIAKPAVGTRLWCRDQKTNKIIRGYPRNKSSSPHLFRTFGREAAGRWTTIAIIPLFSDQVVNMRVLLCGYPLIVTHFVSSAQLLLLMHHASLECL